MLSIDLMALIFCYIFYSLINFLGLNYNVISSDGDIYRVVSSLDSDEIKNVLVKKDNYPNTKNGNEISVDDFEMIGNRINLSNTNILDSYSNVNYEISVNNNQFVINKVENSSSGGKKAPTRGISASDTSTEHVSGVSDNTVYVNDFVSDYNYLKGLNYL